jgi:hypothetical protein
MSHMKRLLVGVALAALLALAGIVTTPALAHNAGHLETPNGKCLHVGAGNEARNQQQDKYPETPYPERDEFGARWAADQGKTPIEPGHRCP